MANLFQGDIRITSNDELFKLTAHFILILYFHSTPHLEKGMQVIRNAIKEEEKKWNNGIIPYEISRSYDGNERAQIAKAIAEIHQETCIKFKARQGENDYIYITKGNGCSSSVGRVGGKQTVSLGAGCVYFGIILHELMHAVGFWHEQSRADRNDYVRINWSNIRNGMEYNFQKYDWTIIQNLG
ncbi:Zinc metalloproteinase nas-6, partial [Armadillidium nasatum]